MKVLIISHNAISTTNNMGKTLLSLFNGFDKEELCQLYIHPMMPDVEVCSSYYRITDEEVLRSLYNFRIPGCEVDKYEIANNALCNRSISCRISKFAIKNKDTALKRLIRDFVWRLSKWDNQSLNDWLEEERPTCIFLAPGYARFIYDIAVIISKKLNIPIVTYICDDYYFVKEPKNFLERLQLRLLKEKMKQIIDESEHLVVISEELKDVYVREFGLPTTVIMTGINYDRKKLCVEDKVNAETLKLSYFGNLACDRNYALAEIGNMLDKINQCYNKHYKLKIYTSDGNKDKIHVFQGVDSIELCGFVSGKAYEKEFFSSDILLHIEAFNASSIDLVKNSISTKIAELLWSGIPILAYGPQEVASIRYLVNNQAAYVINSTNELYDKLTEYLIQYPSHNHFLETAMELAQKNHDSKKNGVILKNLLSIISVDIKG